MKQTLKTTQKLTNKLSLSQSILQALGILKMNQSDLLSAIQTLVRENPTVEYSPSTDMHQFLNETLTESISLKDELYLQLHTCTNKYNEKIANFIIESLDEHGFLSISDDIYSTHLQVSKEEFDRTLLLIQSFEPLGVAAENSIHSISIQLSSKGLHEALFLWNNFQEQLIQANYSLIQKKMNISAETLYDYIHNIQDCDPFPCRNYSNFKTQTLLPDFEINVIDGQVYIETSKIGHIHIDDELRHKDMNPILKNYFNEAYFFVDSLNKRNTTLLLMANAILSIQKNHFLFDDELHPCTLKDIAMKTNFHESTVSRTLSNKYYLFAGEIYPVKNLFVSSTSKGSSKVAIQKALLDLIKSENNFCPYSDIELVEELALLDLQVSRRAVSKYRNQLSIPNSRKRKIELR